MNWLATLRHIFWDISRIVGLRDRLRCPMCQAVGTYKPHGGWLDFDDSRKVRRWMCKWCGHYVGPEGTTQVGVNFEKGYWDFNQEFRPQDHVRGVRPWAG